MKDVKPGYKTTEFWMASIAGIAGMIVASGYFAEGGLVLQVVGFAGTILGTLGYAVSRGIAKK